MTEIAETAETTGAETQTFEELTAGLGAEIARIRAHRKLIAIIAYRLRGSSHFCERGLNDFYSELGIPYQYGGDKPFKALQAWNGDLLPGPRDRWKIPYLDLGLLEDDFDPSMYSETGLKQITERLRASHLEWVSEVRSRSMEAQRRSDIGLQALVNAFTKAGIELPQTTTNVQLSVRVGWNAAGPRKNIDEKAIQGSLKTLVSEWAAEHGGTQIDPAVSIHISETVQ